MAAGGWRVFRQDTALEMIVEDSHGVAWCVCHEGESDCVAVVVVSWTFKDWWWSLKIIYGCRYICVSRRTDQMRFLPSEETRGRVCERNSERWGLRRFLGQPVLCCLWGRRMWRHPHNEEY